MQGAGLGQAGWDGSIVAINAYNSTPNGTAQGYSQTLALLPFSSNGNTLPVNSTDTITLDQTIVDGNGKTVPVTLYDLIFAQANNLFPVVDQSESLTFTPPYVYPPVTVASEAASVAVNTLLFIQDINAFPTSTVAKGFQAAVNGATTSATSSTGMTNAINAFFATTTDFQNVTFDSYIAVSTYLYNFAFAWASFSSNYTYYLYQSSGSTPQQGGGATLLGTVTFDNNGASGVPSLTDTNGGYTITYTDENNNATPLYFNSQQLVSEVGAAAPSICLQMSYMELSQFTGQSSDAATLVPVAFGNLNGINVMGVYTEKPSDSGFLVSVENFFNSKGMQLVFQLIGLMMGIKMLCEGASWLRSKFKSDEDANGGNDVSPDQAAANRQQAEDVESDMEADLSSVDSRLGSGNSSAVPSNESEFADDEASDTSSEEEEDVSEQAASEQEELNAQESQLETESQIGVNTDMQDVAADVRSEQSDIDNLDPSNVSASEATLNADQSTISGDQSTLNTVAEQDELSFTAAQENQVQEDEDLATDEEDEEEEENDADDEASDGDDLEDLDDL